MTPTEIFIGLGYSSQSASGDRAIGAAGAAPSYDTRDVFNTVINYANRHGGFAGRRLAPLFYDYNLTDDQSAQEQSACAHWTQDNKVLFIDAKSELLSACAEKSHAVPLGSGTAETFRRFPHLIDSDGIRLDRMGTVTVSGLYRAGYFTGKLGLVTWDDPAYRYTISNGYLPALRARGISPLQVAYISVPQQAGALADSSSAVSSAITKFRSLGIDHVIIQDGRAGVFAGTGLTFEWMQQAKSQQYFPRYGQNIYNAPGSRQLPSDEMDHALAIDQSDYDAKFDQGWQPNRARAFCFGLQAGAGYPVSSANDEALAAQACDTIFLIQRALNGVSAVDAGGIIDAVAGFGTSFQTAEVYGTKFLPGRRDGGDRVRTEEYLASCQCLKFLGAPYYAD